MSKTDMSGKRATKARRRHLARAHALADGFKPAVGEDGGPIDLGGDGGGA